MTDKRALGLALVLNLALALVEIVAGLWARSLALLVDAADFLEDSAIYGLALRFGLGPDVSVRFGLFIAGLMAMPGLVALRQLYLRFTEGGVPDGGTIWQVSVLALAANLISALVIARARAQGRPRRLGLEAAWLSARNDALANLAMIAAGVLVAATHAAWPDTVVGLGIAVLHFSGAIAVARLSLTRMEPS